MGIGVGGGGGGPSDYTGRGDTLWGCVGVCVCVGGGGS